MRGRVVLRSEIKILYTKISPWGYLLVKHVTLDLRISSPMMGTLTLTLTLINQYKFMNSKISPHFFGITLVVEKTSSFILSLIPTGKDVVIFKAGLK